LFRHKTRIDMIIVFQTQVLYRRIIETVLELARIKRKAVWFIQDTH